MSWKSFVTAGLLCALASPAFAAPRVNATANGNQASGHLNTAGEWVLTIQLAQSTTPVDLPDPDGPGGVDDPPPGSPLAAELGFSSNNVMAGIAPQSPLIFDDPNPGNVIWGWETLTDLGGTGNCDSGDPGNCPVGAQLEPAGVDPINEAFIAYGSADLLSDTGFKDFATITTARPVTTNSEVDYVDTVTMSGTYGTGGVKGRIAELNPAWTGGVGSPPISLNYDDYAGSVTRNARGGDANLDGTISGADYSELLSEFEQPGVKQWYDADFNGDSTVSGADYSQLLSNFEEVYTVFSDSDISASPGPGGFSGGSGGVPEPASLALAALAALAIGGLRIRR
jgi:hypothetical protein